MLLYCVIKPHANLCLFETSCNTNWFPLLFLMCWSYAARQRQINHCAFFYFTSQSWALSKKDWGQRRQVRRTEHTIPTHWQDNWVPRSSVCLLFLIWWNGHCSQFCTASVSRTLLINRCGYGMTARWYQPNENMHLVSAVCFYSTTEKLFFPCSKQPFTQAQFPFK